MLRERPVLRIVLFQGKPELSVVFHSLGLMRNKFADHVTDPWVRYVLARRKQNDPAIKFVAVPKEKALPFAGLFGKRARVPIAEVPALSAFVSP